MQSEGMQMHRGKLGAQQRSAEDERPAGANPPVLNHWLTAEREETRETVFDGLIIK